MSFFRRSIIAAHQMYPPIIFLTQWQMMGNSTVHTDEYLTQWKVEGNSVVDNNAILSCGDLGQDGKYHVKISNGVDVYDIALDEPLRKVNDVADTIEFANGVATLTRNFAKAPLGDVFWYKQQHSNGKYRYATNGFRTLKKPIKRAASNAKPANILCPIYDTISADDAYSTAKTGFGVGKTQGIVYVYDENYNQQGDSDAFHAHIQGVELIYEVATPTTEVIQVSPFPVSPTDTYTSANDTPYSSFTHTENKEIWSCGEYSAIDGKYHIVVLPLGKSPVDIALDEPLRKVNDIADKIEFSNGVAIITRNLKITNLGNLSWTATLSGGRYRITSYGIQRYVKKPIDGNEVSNMLCAYYNSVSFNNVYLGTKGVALYASGTVNIYDENYNQSDSAAAFQTAMDGVELIYELATPTTEVIQAPQIQEADSYSCVISQGGKAVEWSSFETE